MLELKLNKLFFLNLSTSANMFTTIENNGLHDYVKL